MHDIAERRAIQRHGHCRSRDGFAEEIDYRGRDTLYSRRDRNKQKYCSGIETHYVAEETDRDRGEGMYDKADRDCKGIGTCTTKWTDTHMECKDTPRRHNY